MATFLALTNRLLRRLNEVELTTATFANATGFHAEAKDAINDAIREINNSEFEWPFNFVSGSQTLSVGQQLYDLDVPINAVDWDSFYLHKQDDANESTVLIINADAGNITQDGTVVSDLGSIISGTSISGTTVSATKLMYLDYDDFMQNYKAQDENMPQNGYSIPRFVFKTQNNKFGVTPLPRRSFVVTYEHFSIPDDLSASTDVPTIPDSFSQVIIDGALWHGYMFRENFESARTQEAKFRKGIANMRTRYINRYAYARAI